MRKINCDASLSESDTNAGITAIVRDCDGNIRLVRAMFVDRCTSSASAELEDIKEGLRLARDSDIKRLNIGSDACFKEPYDIRGRGELKDYRDMLMRHPGIEAWLCYERGKCLSIRCGQVHA